MPPSPSSRLVLYPSLFLLLFRADSLDIRARSDTSHLRHREVRCIIFLLVLLRRYHGGNYRYSIAVLLDDSFKTHSLGLFTWARVLYELGIPVGIISFFLSKEHTMEILGTIEKSRIDFKLAICVLLFYLYHNGA